MAASNPVATAPARDRRVKEIIFVCVALIVASIAAYWQAGKNGYVNFDDPDYVSSNPRVQAGLTGESVRWAFTAMHSSNWHPVTWLSHMLDSQIYGEKAAGPHITNLAWHIVNSLMLFGLLLRMTGALWRSAMVAALFALHPLHVESVAWISERKDVLSTFFGLVTLWAYVRYCNAAASSTVTRGGWYMGALITFALGLMSKPMLVTLPFVLLLLDYWPLGRFAFVSDTSGSRRFRRATTTALLLEKAPFFILTVISCVVTYVAQRASGAVVSVANAPLESRISNALAAGGSYLLKTLWPSQLSPFYPHAAHSFDSASTIAGALVLIALTAGALASRKTKPYLVVGWLWFLGTLVPVIGLVQVGRQGMADRYTYLPHIGLFIAVVWGGAALLGRLRAPRVACATVSVAILAALGAVTFRQVAYWRGSRTLFEHALAVTDGNYVAYGVLANVFIEEKNYQEAENYARKALEFAPQYPEAFNTLGNIYLRQEKYPQAVESYSLAVKCDPSFPDPHSGLASAYMKMGRLRDAEAESREALRLGPLNLPALFTLATSLHQQGKLDDAAALYRRILASQPELFTPHRYLGNLLVAQNKPEEAIPELRRALKIRPDDAETQVVLGVALLQAQKIDDAATAFEAALKLQPENAMANYQLATVYQSTRRAAAAIDHYRMALRANPNWPEVLNNLAWVQAANANPAVRNGPEAVTHAELACKLTANKEPMLLGTLAAAYAEAGRFPDAIKTAEQARDIAAAAGLDAVAKKNAELLELYRAGKAWHEPE
jgi:tetratricopeptide (TPR) repeat protein